MGGRRDEGAWGEKGTRILRKGGGIRLQKAFPLLLGAYKSFSKEPGNMRDELQRKSSSLKDGETEEI